ncbi:MAG TPA: hypothetical protein VGA32_06200 [Anaerolineales bacterium]
MNLVERSEFRSEDGSISLEQRLQATLKFGLNWYADMQGQDFVTQRLKRSLGKEYVLIRNLTLPGTPMVLPLIVLGPQGVQVLLATSARGVFRAKDNEWLSFDARARVFRRSHPNLQAEVTAHAHGLFEFFKQRGYTLPEVEAVLVFANPRTHVDVARPGVRIVLADAIDHFAANLLQFPPIMSKGDVDLLISALLEPPPTAPPVEEAKAAPPRPAPPPGIPPPKRKRGALEGVKQALLKEAQAAGLKTGERQPRRPPDRRAAAPEPEDFEIEEQPAPRQAAELPPWQRGASAKPPQTAEPAPRARRAAAKPPKERRQPPPASGATDPPAYAMTYLSPEPERAARSPGLSGCQVFLLFLFALVLVVVVGVVSYVLLGGTLPPLPPITLPF